MRAVIPLLVLLFSMCGAQTESQSTGAAAAVTTQLDVSAELRELRDMVVELRVLLTVTQNELQKLEAENAAVKTEVMNLKMENAAQEARLFATETDMEHVKKDTAAQNTNLNTMKTEVENLKMETASELTAVKTKLTAAETEVVNLEKKITEQPKVAFSAGLTNSRYIKAGETDLNLIFTKIITNVGQAYSNITGFFTAPVKGVYYFRFTVADNLHKRIMEIKMFKNGEQIMWLQEVGNDGEASYLSSGATLQLGEGDVVNMRIPAGRRLFDNENNPSTFSGFLLFPL